MATVRLQFGALPFGQVDGRLQVMLVTSRESRRWIIPKGWPMKGKAPHQTAAREAFEEAGVKGEVTRRPIGSYEYDKRLHDGVIVPCLVEVYALHVLAQRRRWPEYLQRETAWFPPTEAASLVREPGLAALIGGFAAADVA